MLFWVGTALAGGLPISAGTFTQGRAALPHAPAREVQYSAFAIDRSEVSVSDFERFAATGYSKSTLWSDEGWSWVQANPGGAGAEHRAAGRDQSHPVVAVTWYEADAYCRWNGGRLPSEAEWERAACGGLEQRYPWGDEQRTAVWYDHGKTGIVDAIKTQPAGQSPKALHSPDGLLHMAGNVWEWTADWYGSWTAGVSVQDPRGPSSGQWRTLRGGSFMNLPSYCTCANREPARPTRSAYTTGFRCAYD